MTASASSSDELHAYLAEVLAAANSPLTVVSPSPAENPWKIHFRDSRFDRNRHLGRDQLHTLLDTRPAAAVVTALEHWLAAPEIVMAITDTHFRPDEIRIGNVESNALFQGVISVESERDQMTIVVPIDSISLDPPELIGPSALQAIESTLDRLTGTSVDERLDMVTPIGVQISTGTLTPPAWSAPVAPSTTSRPSAAKEAATAVSSFLGSYLTHRGRQDPASSPGPTDSTPSPHLSRQSDPGPQF